VTDTSGDADSRVSSPRRASSGAASRKRSRPLKVPKPPATPGSARVVAIANQKGGVGKSTTAVSLGAALAELGFRVLVVDLDPQGNASTGLGIRHEAREITAYDVLVSDGSVTDAIVPTMIEGLHAVPSTIDLAGAEIELVSQFSREGRLKRALAEIHEGVYDFILLDCPPSLGLLTVNAMTAAEELIVPIQCEYYALEGLGQLLRNVSLVQQNINPELRLSGIVMTMFDPRTKLSEQVVAEVRKFFGEVVYDVVIPRTVRLSEAPGYGQPITIYDPKSRGADAYRQLAAEVATRPPPSEPLPVFDDLPTIVVSRLDDTITHRKETARLARGERGAEAKAKPKSEPEPEPESQPESQVDEAETQDAIEITADDPETAEAGTDSGDESSTSEEAEAWLGDLAKETEEDKGGAFLSQAVAEVVQEIGDEEFWEHEESADPKTRVSTPTSPAPPGQLPNRRVVVIDENAPVSSTPPAKESTVDQDEQGSADIGKTMQDENPGGRRRWRRHRKGGQ
jgi:chromosome partitioning protein